MMSDRVVIAVALASSTAWGLSWLDATDYEVATPKLSPPQLLMWRDRYA